MKIGYARISSSDQSLALQKDALEYEGCDRIFEDTASGARTERPGLDSALNILRKGDMLVVWRLDRLGRSLKHLIETVEKLDGEGIGFKSLKENIDTTTSGGKLVFHIFGALAEFEREIIRERTKSGLAAARARGRNGGRPRTISDDKIKLARELHKDHSKNISEICRMLGISRPSFYRLLKG